MRTGYFSWHSLTRYLVLRFTAVSTLLKPDVSDRIRSSGIRFFVVLSPYETSRTEGDATFIGVGFHGTSIVSTNLIAGLVDLDNPESYEHLETKARGEDSATWIGPYLGLFVFGSVPETEESAMDGMAQRIVEEIRQVETGQHVKIMVVAGNWESARLSYPDHCKKSCSRSGFQPRFAPARRSYKTGPESHRR